MVSAAPMSEEDTLSKRLLANAAKRPALLDDCVRIIDEEVEAKGGLTGLAIKGAYKIVGAIKPGIIRESMDMLLDDFVLRLEPLYAEHRDLAKGPPGAFGEFMQHRAGAVAESLLGITDDRARQAKNATLKGAYDKLRPQAKKHVEEAIPRIARTLSKHLA